MFSLQTWVISLAGVVLWTAGVSGYAYYKGAKSCADRFEASAVEEMAEQLRDYQNRVTVVQGINKSLRQEVKVHDDYIGDLQQRFSSVSLRECPSDTDVPKSSTASPRADGTAGREELRSEAGGPAVVNALVGDYSAGEACRLRLTKLQEYVEDECLKRR